MKLQTLDGQTRTGVQIKEICGVFETTGSFDAFMDRTWWHELLGIEFRVETPTWLPDSFPHSVLFRVPIIDVPTYIAWLEAHAHRHGVRSIRGPVHAIDEQLSHECALVVVAAGQGSTKLVGGMDMRADIRQVVCIPQRESLDNGLVLLSECGTQTAGYAVPGTDHFAMGSEVVSSPSSGRIQPDPDTTEAILQTCTQALPHMGPVQRADLIGVTMDRSFRRQGAFSVAVESTRFKVPVIYAYGNGCQSLNNSWGLAEYVESVTTQILRPYMSN